MKRITALLIAVLMLISLVACGDSEQSGKSDSDKKSADTSAASTPETDAETDAETEAETDGPTEAPAADIAGWNWVKGELDCYSYDDYYMSYSYPEQFKTSSEDSSGLQSRGYYYNPDNADADANSSPYGIYITFGQGSFGGATKSSLEETMSGGLTERDLGGKKVLFGELSSDPNTGSHAFAYYLTYDEDEWARIWIILCDPEADGEFRRTFEESMSFTK